MTLRTEGYLHVVAGGPLLAAGFGLCVYVLTYGPDAVPARVALAAVAAVSLELFALIRFVRRCNAGLMRCAACGGLLARTGVTWIGPDGRRHPYARCDDCHAVYAVERKP